jgi:[protein-PII] uridylyltransferase
MGLVEDDVRTIQTMIEHHLLLADVATHRDLSDDATITYVAERAGNVTTLELLHALTEADSLATGPSAWSAWKSDLVTSLAQRVSHVLGGGDVSEATWRLFPSADVLLLMSEGGTSVTFGEGSVTVVSPDRPGTFATVAGVLSLNNLDVLGAEAYSDEGGDTRAPMAASEFRVAAPPYSDFDWNKVRSEVVSSLLGEFPLEERLRERDRSARPRRVLAARTLEAPVVRLDNSVSSNATFVEVRAPDSVGILHRITRVLADAGLDIRHARVQTLGSEVVDTFYVRDANGEKVDVDRDGESIRTAVLNALIA